MVKRFPAAALMFSIILLAMSSVALFYSLSAIGVGSPYEATAYWFVLGGTFLFSQAALIFFRSASALLRRP